MQVRGGRRASRRARPPAVAAAAAALARMLWVSWPSPHRVHSQPHKSAFDAPL